MKSLTQWVETYSAAMKRAERHGNDHGDIDTANHARLECKKFQDEIESLRARIDALEKQKAALYKESMEAAVLAGARIKELESALECFYEYGYDRHKCGQVLSRKSNLDALEAYRDGVIDECIDIYLNEPHEVHSALVALKKGEP